MSHSRGLLPRMSVRTFGRLPSLRQRPMHGFLRRRQPVASNALKTMSSGKSVGRPIIHERVSVYVYVENKFFFVLDRRQTFHKHVSMVARSCNYHAQAIHHIIRHLLSTELAQTLVCSLILSRIDYCNAVLHGAPTTTIQKLQRVQNNAARIVLQASRRSHAKPLLHQLHWLPVQQRITYKLAVLTYKVRSTSTSVYLHRRIAERVCSRTLCSSAIPLS